MQVDIVPIERVVPYARNPRKNQGAVAKVAASLKEFGWRQPIVVDSEMVVIAGHTRLMAAQSLGMAQVPVHVAEGLTPAQVKAYRIADNRVGEEAEWDADLLKIEFEDLEANRFNLELTGFDMHQIELYTVGPSFEPGTQDDQGRLDQLAPKMCTCPHCGGEFDLREHGQG